MHDAKLFNLASVIAVVFLAVSAWLNGLRVYSSDQRFWPTFSNMVTCRVFVLICFDMFWYVLISIRPCCQGFFIFDIGATKMEYASYNDWMYKAMTLKLHPQPPSLSQCHVYPFLLQPRWQFSLTEWLGDSGIFRQLVGWLGKQYECRVETNETTALQYLWFSASQDIFDLQFPWQSKKDCELHSSDHLACNPLSIHLGCAFVLCCTDGPMTNLNLSAGLPRKDERSFAT